MSFPVNVPRPLRDVLESLIDRIRVLCPGFEVHSLLDSPPQPNETRTKSQALHISLTHPLPLRRSQTKAFQADLTHRLAEGGSKSFKLSLAGALRVYYNGRRYGGEGKGGRAFLALRVGAGSDEVSPPKVRRVRLMKFSGSSMPRWRRWFTRSYHLSIYRCTTTTRSFTRPSLGVSSVQVPLRTLRRQVMRLSMQIKAR